jgi:Ca2+-binding RTX toxin-like protein
MCANLPGFWGGSELANPSAWTLEVDMEKKLGIRKITFGTVIAIWVVLAGGCLPPVDEDLDDISLMEGGDGGDGDGGLGGDSDMLGPVTDPDEELTEAGQMFGGRGGEDFGAHASGAAGTSASSTGVGAAAGPDETGVAQWKADPCLTLTPTHRGTDGPDTIRGTAGRDIIFTGSGDDTIWGNGGSDIICAGGGADRIYGGIGNDYIDAGFGRDIVDGGAGNDTVHGRSGGDQIRGGAGDDLLFGDLLDDDVYGDDGNDILIGGHGNDLLHGGKGNDWLRGDTNRDEFVGGRGNDTASFMTATPPGQSLGEFTFGNGVIVDNNDVSEGWAAGDGKPESMAGVETIIGSAFDDFLAGAAGTARLVGGFGNDRIDATSGAVADGGPGADSCSGAPCDTATEPAARPAGGFVFLGTGPTDLGLVVLGSPGNDVFLISVSRGVAHVDTSPGTTLTPGPGCTAGAGPHQVRCVLAAQLRYIVGWGGAGDDYIDLQGGGFPRDMEATLDGGDGNDTLSGHGGQDIMFTGRTGNDNLIGNAGDDALLSLSTDADIMDAGGGNDQLVSNYPCGGHIFGGGGGVDVGGFARVGTHFDTAAERHRQRILAHIGFRAYQPAFCDMSEGTHLQNDIEILEGAGGNDELIGNDRNNTIWGWGGDDTIRGLGGNDTIEGHKGNDIIYGGAGRDRLRGNAGVNTLHARDGEADVELNCGSGGSLERDPSDPRGDGCG